MTGQLPSAATTAADQLVQYLTAHVDIRQGIRPQGWAYACVEALVLHHGRWFHPAPLPADRRPGPDRQCFANAAEHARRHHLTYVEGYAYHPVGLTTLHAWAAHPDGTVEDPTWADPPGSAYLGIALSPQYLREFATDGFHGSVLGNPHLDDYRLLRRGLPDAAVLPLGNPPTCVQPTSASADEHLT